MRNRDLRFENLGAPGCLATGCGLGKATLCDCEASGLSPGLTSVVACSGMLVTCTPVLAAAGSTSASTSQPASANQPASAELACTLATMGLFWGLSRWPNRACNRGLTRGSIQILDGCDRSRFSKVCKDCTFVCRTTCTGLTGLFSTCWTEKCSGQWCHGLAHGHIHFDGVCPLWHVVHQMFLVVV